MAPLLLALLAAAPPKLAVMPISPGEGVPPATAAAVTEALAAEVRRRSGAEVITQREIESVLSLEAQKAMLGCDTRACMAELGGALGVERLVAGTLARLGESWLVHLEVVETGKVKARSGIGGRFSEHQGDQEDRREDPESSPGGARGHGGIVAPPRGSSSFRPRRASPRGAPPLSRPCGSVTRMTILGPLAWGTFVIQTVSGRGVFPAWGGAAERLRHLLRYAVAAPSPHDSQPWIFEIAGPELRVFVDPRRTLRTADPEGREAVLACGAAIENLRIAAAHHGHDVEVEACAHRPGGPLAIVRFAGRRPPTGAEEALHAAIGRQRLAAAIRSLPVPPDRLLGLAEEVQGDGLVRRVPRWLARPVAELVAEADAQQWSSARFRAERAAWSRGRIHGRPGAGSERPGFSPAALLRRLLQLGGGRRAELDRRCDERTRTLILLSTREDGPADWLAAGRALQRVALRAEVEGLAVAPMNQPVEVAGTRRRLRRELGDPGWPQALLRVGYRDGAALAPAPRRPIDLVLRSFDAGLEVEVEEPAAAVSA